MRKCVRKSRVVCVRTKKINLNKLNLYALSTYTIVEFSEACGAAAYNQLFFFPCDAFFAQMF